MNTVRNLGPLHSILIANDAARTPSCRGISFIDPIERLGYRIEGSDLIARGMGKLERMLGITGLAKERDVAQGAWFDFLVANRLLETSVWKGYHPIFLGWSSWSLLSGRKIQTQGGAYIVMSQWSHALHQERQVRQEWEGAGRPGSPYSHWRLTRQLKEYQAADLILCPSRYVQQSHLDACASPDKLLMIPYGVDCGRFSDLKGGRPAEYQGAFHMLFVGSVILRKGIKLLLEACALLRIQDCVLTLNGDPDRACLELIESSREALRRNAIRLRVDPGPPERNLRWADVLVHPAAEEAFGLAVLEAMAAGVPPIVSDQVGAKDCITDAEDGFICKARHPQAFANAVMALYRDKDLRVRVGALAAKKARGFDWAVVTRRLEADILDRFQETRPACQ